jgi:hypothetical protein
MSIASLAGFAAALPGIVKAQFTEQEVRNGADVVATGDVDINQSASGSQIVDINGTPINGDGIYRTSSGQVVVNDGRVVATGDVSVNQSASASQATSVLISPPEYEGQYSDYCTPGAVMANPQTGQLFYQRDDCCWYVACAVNCKKSGCEGNNCG